MIVLRPSAFVVAAFAGCAVLTPLRVQAQWWRSAPVDFEECADKAEKAATKQDETAALAGMQREICGRRKPGGGYTYYDFMQDRFRYRRSQSDAGRAEENRRAIHRLSGEPAASTSPRRSGQATAAATAPQGVQQASLRGETEKVPVPVASPVKQAVRSRQPTAPRARSPANGRDLGGNSKAQKLFGSTPSKAKRS